LVAKLHRLEVSTPQGFSGSLAKESDTYLFGYANADANAAIIALLWSHPNTVVFCRLDAVQNSL
jgi:hypothetical protein